jgi:hypothetical protein
MADDLSASVADLYETDFFAWTQEQAALLRARAESDLVAGLDWLRLAEEVGDMGSAQREKCYSLAIVALEHLFKLYARGRTEPHGHWRREVRAARGALARALTPSIRAALVRDWKALLTEARELASEGFVSEEPQVLPLRSDVEWTIAQILGEQDDPLQVG